MWKTVVAAGPSSIEALLTTWAGRVSGGAAAGRFTDCTPQIESGCMHSNATTRDSKRSP